MDIFSLNWADIGKGVLVAFLTVFLAAIGQSIDAGTLPSIEQIKVAALAGLAAGIAYLIKQFFTNTVAQAKKTLDKAGIKYLD